MKNIPLLTDLLCPVSIGLVEEQGMGGLLQEPAYGLVLSACAADDR